MKRFIQFILILAAFIACAALPIGCKSTLESGGAYAPNKQVVENGVTNTVATFAPDKAFFLIDSAYDLTYTTIDELFNIEKKNRQLLFTLDPDIKHKLDKLRPQALQIAREYSVARRAYQSSPTPAGLSVLQTILSRAKAVATAVQSALPQQ